MDRVTDPEQLALDYEDVCERLERLRCAILRRDELAAEVARLKRELTNARRKHRESEWDVSTLIARERRSPSLTPSKEPAADEQRRTPSAGAEMQVTQPAENNS
jgi:hypothetical protein